MDIPLWITIGLMVLVAAATAGLWARDRGPRPLVAGLGVLLVPLGLFLTGLMRLTYNGVVSLVDWAQRTAWNATMSWGVGLVVAGVALFFLSRLLKPGEGKRVDVAPGKVEQRRPAPAVDGRKAAAAPAARPGKSPAGPAGLSDEDAEVEAILRKRGIM